MALRQAKTLKNQLELYDLGDDPRVFTAAINEDPAAILFDIFGDEIVEGEVIDAFADLVVVAARGGRLASRKEAGYLHPHVRDWLAAREKRKAADALKLDSGEGKFWTPRRHTKQARYASKGESALGAKESR